MAREKFGSSLASLLVMAGSAVGLGNIWRFPSMMGQYGGAAFLLVYILAVLLVGVPILVGESICGRRSRLNPVGTFTTLSGGSGTWSVLGYIFVISPIIVASYYTVIGGWTINYLIKSLMGVLTSSESAGYYSGLFSTFVASPFSPVIYHTLFLALSSFIVYKGVKGGIEKSSKVMMPVLFLMMAAVAVWAITLPGAGDGLKYMFKPDLGRLDSEVCMAAVGQAFFSLSLGCGTMMTYASFCSEEDNILRNSVRISFFDLVFAIIAGCAVMCAVFAYGMEPTEGTGLVFETLPLVFSRMPMGYAVSGIFFISLVLAAVTSEISVVEECVTYLVERKGWSRGKSLLAVFAVAWVLGDLCCLSFGPLSGLKLGGLSIFGSLDYLAANILLPVGGFLIVMLVGWKMSREDVRDEFSNHGQLAGRMFPALYFLIKYVAPLALILIFISGLL